MIVAGGGVRASAPPPSWLRWRGAGVPVATSLSGRIAFGPASCAVGVVGSYWQRQPGGQSRRPGLLRRHRDRRHDHAFLGSAADRHAGDQIDIEAQALSRNYPLKVAINGDAKVTSPACWTRSTAPARRGEAWIAEAR